MDSDPLLPPERTDPAGPKRPGSTASHRLEGGYTGADPPTVRSVPAAAPGSSFTSSRRVQLVSGPVALPLPVAGDRIDTFAMEVPIGVGGMGAVFRALDTRLDRHVALKILPPEQAYDPEVVQRFYQEGRAAARLDHENIARVFSIGHDGRYHYIAFEYIEGTTVRQRVEKNGPLPAGEAINYTLQIADALVHAAERGVVHRDIKPSNIIVTPHGRAKLVDMGLARRFERGGDDGLTQSGMTLGTFDYISPEQARDPRDVDVRSDLYSLGCTLFHMLTGRPPFPEGTVLQKLIQHQEEPPPDVRALNPSVPADLAAVLVKLMAKDRDRRYQTPEQLVRDLLTVAGALGLRSVSPEGLVWLAASPPSAWERHLVWGVPVLVFAMIIGGLVWWGQDAGRSSSGSPAPADALAKLPVSPPAPASKSGRPPSPAPDTRAQADAQALPESGPFEPAAGGQPPVPPRDYTVEPGDDLWAVIAQAPPRSVILLTGDGPYELGGGRDDRTPADRLRNRDLTVRADAGARPVLRLARGGASGGKARPALLDFHGGRVTLDGLEFDLDPGVGRSEPLAAVRTEGTELTVRRCVFRRPGILPTVGASRAAGVYARSAPADAPGSDRPSPLALDTCHFQGVSVGVRANGPADVLLRDCTLAGVDSAVWFDNGREAAAAPVPADLRCRHVSVAASEGAVFRFEGTEARVSVDDSVVSAAGSREATLAATDLPEALAWRGRGNLYARVGTFLQAGDREAVRDPARWRDDDFREAGVEFVVVPVWEQPDISKALALDAQNPSRAFRLAPRHPGAADVGARQGPFGTPIVPAVRLASAGSGPAAQEKAEPKATRTPAPADPDERRGAPEPVATATPPPAEVVASPADPEASATSRMNELPEMPVMPTAGVGSREKEKDRPATEEPAEAAAVVTPSVKPTNPSPAPAEDRAVARTLDQFLNVLKASGARGGTVRVAADANWELPPTVVRASGALRVQAEPGPTRPRLRFLPAAAEVRSPASWSAMIELRSGSLHLEGFDVVLPAENAPRQGRWAAFAVRPATDLNLTGCTVTVEGDQAVSAVVAVEPVENEGVDAENAPEPAASTVRATDCLLRAGGDLVDLAAGRRLVLELDNALASTGGSLVHAHGLPRGQTAEPMSLTLRQVTARTAGGLVYLESAPGEPELPRADVNARYSVLATTAATDVPLIRVDGQDAPASMRNQVHWEGLGVGYHQLSTYRRDQSAQVGAEPTLYDRASWIVAVGSGEQSAAHGDLKFRQDWDPKRPAWTLDRDDARLTRDSPARASGPELDRIPSPPPARP